MNRTVRWALYLAFFVFLLLYPKLFGIYFTNSLVTCAIFALYAVTLNLLLGFTGLLSFGHSMYFGVGAYGTALALTHIRGLPLIPSVLIGFAAALVLGLILCPLVVRVSGTAFSMLHLAFGQLMYVLALKLRGITGGEDGVGGFPIPPFNIPGVASFNMKDPLQFYYFAMVVLAVSVWILWFFTKTPLGSIMVGIRDNAKRVNFLGFQVPKTKAIIYLFAGGFAGVAGSISALFHNLVSAGGDLSIMNSFNPVMIAVVGGIGSFFGPIVGSAIFAVIAEFTSRYTERVELVMGLILIVVILYTPMGFMGIVDIVRQKWLAKSQGLPPLAGASAAEPASLSPEVKG